MVLTKIESIDEIDLILRESKISYLKIGTRLFDYQDFWLNQ